MTDPTPTPVDPRAWRENKGLGWHRDIGYQIQDVLNQHIYSYTRKGRKPDDPGWHECRCGWEGYWSDFHPHVADLLRPVVLSALAAEARKDTADA